MITATRANSAAWLARITGWALFAVAVATLLRSGLITHAITGLWHDRGGDGLEDVIARIELYSKVLPPLAIAALITAAVLGGSLARALRGSARTWVACGSALLVVVAFIDTLAWMRALDINVLGPSAARWFATVDIVSGQVGFALLLVGAAQLARASGHPLPGSLFAAASPFLVWPMLYWLHQVHGQPSTGESPWVSFFAGHGIWACGVAWVGYILVRAGSGGRGFAPAESGDGSGRPLGREWSGAASGLRLYADALSWRLALTIIGYVLLLFAVLGQSMALAKLVAWMLPLALAVTTTVMVVGIFRFSRQPGHSPARGTAAAAFASMLVGGLVQIWSLLLVLQVLGGSQSSHRKLRELGDQAQSMDTWALALGFLALVLLLVSFAQLANYLGARQLFGRVVGVGSAIVLLAFAALGFRAWLTSAGAQITTVLSMAILVLGFALFVVIAYIQLARAVEQAIRERLADSDGPPMAVVVNE